MAELQKIKNKQGLKSIWIWARIQDVLSTTCYVD